MGLLKNGLRESPTQAQPPSPRVRTVDDPAWWTEHADALLARSVSFADAPGFVALVDVLGDRVRATTTIATLLGESRQMHVFRRTCCPCCSMTLAITDDARAVCVRPGGCAGGRVVAALGERAQVEADRLVVVRREQAERATAAERARAERERVEAERQARDRDSATCTLTELPSPTRDVMDLYAALAYDDLDSVDGSDDRKLGKCPACSSALVVRVAYYASFADTEIEARCMSGCAPQAIHDAITPRARECGEQRLREEQAECERIEAERAEAECRAAADERAAFLSRYSLNRLINAKAPEWILRGVIPDRLLTMLAGDGGSRKTWTLIEWSLCLAAGIDWLGHKVKRSRVYLVLLESTDADHGERVRLCAAGLGIDLAVLEREGWLVIHPREQDLQLLDAEHIAELDRAIDEFNPAVVMIDNLPKATRGIDEDNNTKMTLAMGPLERIAKDRAVIILHHVEKKSGKARGAGSIRNNIGHELLIEASKANNAIVTIETGKARLGGSPPIRFRIVGDRLRQEPIVFERVIDEPKKPRPPSDEKRDRMLALLSAARTKDEVYAHVGGRRADAVKLLGALIDERAVVERDDGRWQAANTDDDTDEE